MTIGQTVRHFLRDNGDGLVLAVEGGLVQVMFTRYPWPIWYVCNDLRAV